MLNIRFFPAGASNPTTTAQDIKGVASIVRNGTAGEWLITLQDSYKRLLSAQATIQMATAMDLVPQIATVSNLGTTSAVTLLVRANAVATPTDIAANANHFAPKFFMSCFSCINRPTYRPDQTYRPSATGRAPGRRVATLTQLSGNQAGNA